MSAFTENALIKKLGELNSSSQSIQTLSLWLIHHRKHHQKIVKIWLKELQKAQPNRKLVFMYLSNDVIQNSKKKGPEYGESFSQILAKAFKDIALRCEDRKTFDSLDRILKIWDERGVYESEKIKEFDENLKSNPKTAPIIQKEPTTVEVKKKKEETSSRKRKTEEPSTSATNGSSNKKKPKVPLSTPSSKPQNVKAITMEVNGKVETHVTLSPQHHTVVEGDPPEPEELIKMLMDLEEAASSDAATREKITKLPPEVSDVNILAKLEDKEAALKLSRKVNDAVQLLRDYNTRLSNEMTERNKVTVMLKDFQREQQELLAQAELRLEEYTTKLKKIKEVQNEVKNHLGNLPDITNLPDVTGGGLAPLPSAGDLFNIHH